MVLDFLEIPSKHGLESVQSVPQMGFCNEQSHPDPVYSEQYFKIRYLFDIISFDIFFCIYRTKSQLISYM